MKAQKQFYGIQYLRGLAALAVVFCHFGSNLVNSKRLSVVFSNGQLGVHVFFLISGFVIVYALINNDYHPKYFFRFLLKRSVRIEPLYIVAVVLFILIFELLNNVPSFKGPHFTFIPGQFLAHIFYVVPFTKWGFYNHVFWTLGVEFQFYILMGLVYFISSDIIFRITFLMLFSMTAFIPMQEGYYLVFNYAPIFAAGITLTHYYKEGNKLYLAVFIITFVLIFLHFGWLIFLLLLSAAFIIWFVTIEIKILSFFGSISYSLYVTHVFVVYGSGIWKKLLFNRNELELPLLFLKASIAVLLAFIFYKLVEQPTIKLSKRIAYNISTPSLETATNH